MTVIAGALRIDDVAAIPDKIAILSAKVERDGRDLQSDPNFFLVAIVIAVVVATQRVAPKTKLKPIATNDTARALSVNM